MFIKLKSKFDSTRMINVLLTFFVLCVCIIGLSSMQKVFADTSYAYTWTGSVSVNTVAQFNVAFDDSTDATVSITKSNASTLVSGDADFSASITSQAGDTNEVWTITHTSKNITGVTLVSSKFKLGDWTAKEAVYGNMSYLVNYGSAEKEYVNVTKIPGMDLKVDNDAFEVSEILDIYENNGALMYHTLWFISKKDGTQINSAHVVIIALDLVSNVNDLLERPISFKAKEINNAGTFIDYSVCIRSSLDDSPPDVKFEYYDEEMGWQPFEWVGITLSQEVVSHNSTNLVCWIIEEDTSRLQLHDWHAIGDKPLKLHEESTAISGIYYRFEVEYVELDDKSGVWNMKTEDIVTVGRDDEVACFDESNKYLVDRTIDTAWNLRLKYPDPNYTLNFIIISAQEIGRVHIPEPYPTDGATQEYCVLYQKSENQGWALASDRIGIKGIESDNSITYELENLTGKYELETVGDKLYIKPKESTDIISIIVVGLYQEHELQKWHHLPAELLASQVYYNVDYIREAGGDDVDLYLLWDYVYYNDEPISDIDDVFKGISVDATKSVNPLETWLLCNKFANQFKIVDHIAPHDLSIVCDKVWSEAVGNDTIVKFCFDEYGDGTEGIDFWVKKVVPGEGDPCLKVTVTTTAGGQPDWDLATSQCIVGNPGDDPTKTINAVISVDASGREHWIITVTGYDVEAMQYTIEEKEIISLRYLLAKSKRTILEGIREYALTISGTYNGTVMENVPLLTITSNSDDNTVTIRGADYNVSETNTIHLTQLIKAMIYDGSSYSLWRYPDENNSIVFESATDSEQINVIFYLGEKKGVSGIEFTIDSEIILSYNFFHLPVVKYPIKADGNGGICCINDIEYKIKKRVGDEPPTYETID